jgi:hypothetical protein
MQLNNLPNITTSKNHTTMKPTIENYTESLQNFADVLGLTVHVKHYYDDKRKQPKFYLCKGSTSISPVLDYNGLNNFMLGYSRCKQLNNL